MSANCACFANVNDDRVANELFMLFLTVMRSLKHKLSQYIHVESVPTSDDPGLALECCTRGTHCRSRLKEALPRGQRARENWYVRTVLFLLSPTVGIGEGFGFPSDGVFPDVKAMVLVLVFLVVREFWCWMLFFLFYLLFWCVTETPYL